MTTSMDNRIDALVKRIRAYPALSDFVFMNAYPPRELPNPISRYTVTAENAGVQTRQYFIGAAKGARRCGCIEEAQIVMRVFAPSVSSGSALLRASALLARAAEVADTEHLIETMSLSGIGFDTAARTYYRDVRLTLTLCEEVSDDGT